MGHLENLGLVVLVVLCEKQDISVERVDCHSFAIVSPVGILDVDVFNFLRANHYVVPVPVIRHFWLLELINGEGRPGWYKEYVSNPKKAAPDKEVVSNVGQINIADSVLLVDSDVLPVKAGGSLQLNIGQPSTWFKGSKVRFGNKALTLIRDWVDPSATTRVVVHPQNLNDPDNRYCQSYEMSRI